MPKKNIPRWTGHCAALLVYIIFGINPNCSKAVVPQYISPEVFTIVRMLFGAIVFWILSVFSHSEKVERKDFRILFIGAAVLVGTLLAFGQAFSYTSPSYVSLVSATSPLFALIMSAIFLKESISWQKGLGVLVGISGAMMIILFSWKIDANATPLGIFLCFLNILFYTTYLLVTRKISKKYSPITLMKWMFLMGTVMCIPIALPTLSPETCPMLYSAVPISTYLNLSAVLIFATIISYFLLPLSLQVLSPTTVSMYSNLQPVVTICVAIAFGQDIYTWNKPVALVLILIGVYLVSSQKTGRQ